MNLNAMIDGVGPASITGTINPFSEQLTNEIKISVKDMDLTPASPYSGKFAGYRIAEGKLNLDLAYELVGKKLNSKNVITLDRFTFGEKVNSPDATHLPVRLAIAILKDREGKIVLDVPIEGSLDDPKFRIGKVVTRAIVNILEKVATSPFSLLGAVFGGGGEELGYQDFAAGSATLTADDTKKLDSLVKGLYARPALGLEISGSVDPDGDREGLQRAALDQQIRTRIWMKLRKSEQATNSVDQLVLAPDDRAHWVKKIYAEAVAAGKNHAGIHRREHKFDCLRRASFAAQNDRRTKARQSWWQVKRRARRNEPPPKRISRRSWCRRPTRWKPCCWRCSRSAKMIWPRSPPAAPRRCRLTFCRPAKSRRRGCSSSNRKVCGQDGSRVYLQFR